MLAYVLMVAVTFALLLYLNRRDTFKRSNDSFTEGMFVGLYLVLALVWPVSLPVTVIIAGTLKLMRFLMRGND